MTDCFEPQHFIRHNRQLRALKLENQAWFCLQDVARLMGKALDERATHKLDSDQRRTAWLTSSGRWSKQLLISESGLYAMLVHHYVPENRALRQWLTHDVLPVLHEKNQPHVPRPQTVKWPQSKVGMVQWQSEYWVRLRDVPQVMEGPRTRGLGFWKKSVSFWRGRLEA